MKTILFAAAAVSCLFAAPSFAAPVNAGGSFQVAQLGVDINVGGPRREREGVVVRERRPDRVIVRERERCRMVETRVRRDNGTVVIRRERRCR